MVLRKIFYILSFFSSYTKNDNSIRKSFLPKPFYIFVVVLLSYDNTKRQKRQNPRHAITIINLKNNKNICCTYYIINIKIYKWKIYKWKKIFVAGTTE